MRKLTIKRETVDLVDLLERGELEQIVGASISCPITRLRDQVYDLLKSDSEVLDTNVPTVCHCP